MAVEREFARINLLVAYEEMSSINEIAEFLAQRRIRFEIHYTVTPQSLMAEYENRLRNMQIEGWNNETNGAVSERQQHAQNEVPIQPAQQQGGASTQLPPVRPQQQTQIRQQPAVPEEAKQSRQMPALVEQSQPQQQQLVANIERERLVIAETVTQKRGNVLEWNSGRPQQQATEGNAPTQHQQRQSMPSAVDVRWSGSSDRQTHDQGAKQQTTVKRHFTQPASIQSSNSNTSQPPRQLQQQSSAFGQNFARSTPRQQSQQQPLPAKPSFGSTFSSSATATGASSKLPFTTPVTFTLPKGSANTPATTLSGGFFSHFGSSAPPAARAPPPKNPGFGGGQAPAAAPPQLQNQPPSFSNPAAQQGFSKFGRMN
ncbi:hypothetical protein WR25_17065 isoform B [Diploscapter pachys]|uniref:Uncharacterized protein n=1 Tax=Diploscapter pachys TaxID=2018661 RepID=A0A2A2L3S1_9BILA|nr:hypothetical protein WR25_17065 isoform A [Diploscapter pachys]PAV80819.1 hypothetical protein WR25_17065 isoform B [Diploscapter pachys]